MCPIALRQTLDFDFESTSTDKLKARILQAILKAREDGCAIKVRYGKVLICGAGAAGKTNFLNLLVEEDFEEHHISTEVSKHQQVTIASSSTTDKKLKSVAMKAHTCMSTTSKKIHFTKMDIDEEIHLLMSYLPEKCTKPFFEPPVGVRPAEEQGSIESEVYTIPEDMMSSELAANVDSKKLSTKLQVQDPPEKIWDILTFMDTGGQPQFISMLPAVNNFAMITFIVHNMTKSLTDKVVVKHGNENGQDSFDPYFLAYTNHQLIRTLMSYASNVLFPDKKFLNDIKDEKSTSRVHNQQKMTTTITLIGTHSSTVEKIDDIKKIDTKFSETDSVHSGIGNIKRSLNLNYHYLVPIDNKTQNNSIKTEENSERYTDPSVIRDYIHDSLNTQDVYSVPFQWLLLELQIRKECISNNCSFITYKEVMKLSREKKLGEEEYIKQGLQFHHLFGVLLFFDVEGLHELIITNHQWLFDKLTKIVLHSFKKDPDMTNAEYNEYTKKGVFKETVLDKLGIDEDFEKSKIKINVDPKKYFLKLLQHLRIIAPLNEDSTKYFMPSLLDCCNLTNLQEKIPGTSKFVFKTNEIIHSEPLLIWFKSSNNNTNVFPRGIFSFLVVQLMLMHSKKCIWGHKQVYHNLVTFLKRDTAHYITLIDKIFFLEVQVTFKTENMAPVHSEIFDSIVEALHEIGNTLNFNITPEYGFWCKECENPGEEMHISSLQEGKYCCCYKEELTELKPPYTVWFEDSKVCT